VFTTAVPTWSTGDEFKMTGDARRFRILEMVSFMEPDAPFDAMWMDEPAAAGALTDHVEA